MPSPYKTSNNATILKCKRSVKAPKGSFKQCYKQGAKASIICI